MVSEQLNLRLPPQLLADAKREAKRRGFRNVQAFVEEGLRARIYDPELTPAEWRKVERWLKDIDHPERLVPESELRAALEVRIRSGEGRKYSGKHPGSEIKRTPIPAPNVSRRGLSAVS